MSNVSRQQEAHVTAEERDVDAVCNAIARSTGALLLEGLPHPYSERVLLEAERRTKQVREIGGFPFYRTPLSPVHDHETLFRTTFSMPETLPPFSGEKMCGGFHPDFAIEWLGCDVDRHSLLCFGCVEVMSIAPGLALRTDLAQSEFFELYEALRIYRKNRPVGFLDRFDSIVSQLSSGPNDA